MRQSEYLVIQRTNVEPQVFRCSILVSLEVLLDGFGRRVLSGDGPEGERRTERAPGSPVTLPNGRCNAVSRTIETGNGPATGIQHLRAGVDDRPPVGVQHAGAEDNAVIGATVRERVHGEIRTRIVRPARVSPFDGVDVLVPVAIVWIQAALELTVLARFGVTVELGNLRL